MSKRTYRKPLRGFTDDERAFALNNFSSMTWNELAAALVLISGTPWRADQVKQLVERLGQGRGKKEMF